MANFFGIEFGAMLFDCSREYLASSGRRSDDALFETELVFLFQQSNSDAGHPGVGKVSTALE